MSATVDAHSCLSLVALLTSTIGAKRFELLHELVPRASVVAVLHDLYNPASSNELKDVEAAARALGRELVIMRPRSEPEIDAAFTTFAEKRASALFVGAGPFLITHGKKSSPWRSAMLSPRSMGCANSSRSVVS